MVRGTFANIRIRNEMTPEIEGGVTRHLPSGNVMSIYDAAMLYRNDHVPLVVLAGAEYGTGSSRDWAAKVTILLGIRAVIALATSASTAATWSVWASCRCSSSVASRTARWV